MSVSRMNFSRPGTINGKHAVFWKIYETEAVFPFWSEEPGFTSER
jgi:hypothetical protein